MGEWDFSVCMKEPVAFVSYTNDLDLMEVELSLERLSMSVSETVL